MRVFLGTVALTLLLSFPQAHAGVAIPNLIPTDGKVPNVTAVPETISDVSCTGTYGIAGCIPECSFKWGSIHFSCIIPYVGYLTQGLIIAAAGFFLFTVIQGGYFYAIGGAIESYKESGKKAIRNAIIGFAVAILSYLLVDTVIQALT